MPFKLIVRICLQNFKGLFLIEIILLEMEVEYKNIKNHMINRHNLMSALQIKIEKIKTLYTNLSMLKRENVLLKEQFDLFKSESDENIKSLKYQIEQSKFDQSILEEKVRSLKKLNKYNNTESTLLKHVNPCKDCGRHFSTSRTENVETKKNIELLQDISIKNNVISKINYEKDKTEVIGEPEEKKNKEELDSSDTSLPVLDMFTENDSTEDGTLTEVDLSQQIEKNDIPLSSISIFESVEKKDVPLSSIPKLENVEKKDVPLSSISILENVEKCTLLEKDLPNNYEIDLTKNILITHIDSTPKLKGMDVSANIEKDDTSMPSLSTIDKSEEQFTENYLLKNFKKEISLNKNFEKGIPPKNKIMRNKFEEISEDCDDYTLFAILGTMKSVPQLLKPIRDLSIDILKERGTKSSQTKMLNKITKERKITKLLTNNAVTQTYNQFKNNTESLIDALKVIFESRMSIEINNGKLINYNIKTENNIEDKVYQKLTGYVDKKMINRKKLLLARQKRKLQAEQLQSDSDNFIKTTPSQLSSCETKSKSSGFEDYIQSDTENFVDNREINYSDSNLNTFLFEKIASSVKKQFDDDLYGNKNIASNNEFSSTTFQPHSNATNLRINHKHAQNHTSLRNDGKRQMEGFGSNVTKIASINAHETSCNVKKRKINATTNHDTAIKRFKIKNNSAESKRLDTDINNTDKNKNISCTLTSKHVIDNFQGSSKKNNTGVLSLNCLKDLKKPENKDFLEINPNSKEVNEKISLYEDKNPKSIDNKYRYDKEILHSLHSSKNTFDNFKASSKKNNTDVLNLNCLKDLRKPKNKDLFEINPNSKKVNEKISLCEDKNPKTPEIIGNKYRYDKEFLHSLHPSSDVYKFKKCATARLQFVENIQNIADTTKESLEENDYQPSKINNIVADNIIPESIEQSKVGQNDYVNNTSESISISIPEVPILCSTSVPIKEYTYEEPWDLDSKSNDGLSDCSDLFIQTSGNCEISKENKVSVINARDSTSNPEDSMQNDNKIKTNNLEILDKTNDSSSNSLLMKIKELDFVMEGNETNFNKHVYKKPQFAYATFKKFLRIMRRYRYDKECFKILIERYTTLQRGDLIYYCIRVLIYENDKNEEEDDLRIPATHKTVMGIILHFDQVYPNLKEEFMEACEDILLRHKNKPNTIYQIVMIFIPLCMITNNRCRARQLICDALFFLEEEAIYLVLYVLKLWKNIFLDNQKDNWKDHPLIKLLVHKVYTQSCSQTVLGELKDVLYYELHYQRERYNENELIKEFVNKFADTGDLMYETWTLILCKLCSKQWTSTQIEAVNRIISGISNEVTINNLTRLVSKLKKFVL